MSRRRKRSNKDDINPDSWLATYSDTITLLLTFFILLYSMSQVDNEKLEKLSYAMQNQISGEIVNSKNNKVITAPEQTEYEELAEKVNKAIQGNRLTDVVKIREENKGVVLQLDESILFDSGSATLKDNSKELLNTIMAILADVDNDILIEGHTDNVPMKSEKFASNWELSTARAVSVIRYFVEEKDLNPVKFSAKGYAEFKPLVENTTKENKAINRRVDILIIEQKEKK